MRRWRVSRRLPRHFGDRRFNDQWTDQSLDAIEARHLQTREFLRRLYAIDSTALSDTDKLNFELFRRELQNSVDSHQFNRHLMPFSHRGGVQTLNQTSSRIPLSQVSDYEDWLVRLAKIPQVIEQTIALAEEGREKGLMSPAVLMQRVPDQIATQLVENGVDSPFYEEFAELPASFSVADRERLQSAAVETIESDTSFPRIARAGSLFQQHLSAEQPRIHRLVGLAER